LEEEQWMPLRCWFYASELLKRGSLVLKMGDHLNEKWRLKFLRYHDNQTSSFDMRYVILVYLTLTVFITSCSEEKNKELAKAICTNEDYTFLKNLSRDVVKTGFNAGDGYGEVWIRDYNTFITLAAEVHPDSLLRENLLVFFALQGDDGNIIDGFIPVAKARVGYEYRYSPVEPRYAGHKNTVETDQESSLVQAVFRYIQATGDSTILHQRIGEKTVRERLNLSLQYLFDHRFNKEYGLLYGATTADWGDVQPEHEWGVYITKETHYAIDVYDNALFLIAIDNYISMFPEEKSYWQPKRDSIGRNVRKYLWDQDRQKFKPHIYLKGSPFPDDFNEDTIYYHGGTAVAIEAGLLTKDEVKTSLDKMISNMKAANAASIGLTLYPTYPEGFFVNKGMGPFEYQNGGDWDWFGGRMITQLVRFGYVQEAIEQVAPMIQRARSNNGFYEWYTPGNQPRGSGTFRGSAGVLYDAVTSLEKWARSEGGCVSK
jgi:hypothetical protein